MVLLNDVGKVYPGGHRAVRDLRIIAGLEEATSGELLLDGEAAGHLPPRERNVAMVFQDGALYPHRTVGGNMMFPFSTGARRPERGLDVALAVDLDRMLLFDTAGRRIGFTRR